MTVEITRCPTLTSPMSASSTAAMTRIRRRSAATVNSTGDCSIDATVCPGSTLRVMTTPSIGERITA